MTKSENPKSKKEGVQSPQTLESSLSELEGLVTKLEDGNLPLDESLALFERGVTLTKFCNQKIHEAQRKVDLLIKDAEGSFRTEAFDEQALDGASSS